MWFLSNGPTAVMENQLNFIKKRAYSWCNEQAHNGIKKSVEFMRTQSLYVNIKDFIKTTWLCCLMGT